MPLSGRSSWPGLRSALLLGAVCSLGGFTLTAQTTIVWANTSGGTWTTAANWSPATVPATSAYNATISAAGTYTVGLTSSETINKLLLATANATLQITGSQLYLAASGGTSSITAGSLQMASSQIVGDSSSSGHTLANAGTLTATSGSNFIYGNFGGSNALTFTNTGTVSVTGGTLTLGDSNGDAVTNGSGGVMSANGATLVVGGNGASWSNSGTIQAINGGTVTLGSAAWTAGGTLNANTGGTLNLGGSMTTAQLAAATIIGSGGTLNLTGSLANTGATLEAPSSGIFTLYGGTITGGTVDNSTATALTFGVTTSVLNGVAMNGAFTAPAGASFYAENGTSFSNGITSIGNGYIYLGGSAGTALSVASSATLTGNLSIYAEANGVGVVNAGTIANTSGGNYIYGTGHSGFGFTNSGTVTVSGGYLVVGDGTGDTVTNQSGGVFSVTGGSMTLGQTNGSVVNAGTLEASGSSSILTLGYGSATWTNTGNILATNGGTVNLGASFTTANLQGGTIDSNTGGTVAITGSLDNTGATLALPHSGVYTLSGGTILNGTVASGALTFGSSTGILDGVTMLGNFTVPASTAFKAKDNTTFTGGTTTFAPSAYTVTLPSSGTALTLAPSATWTGSFSVSAPNGATWVNQGTLANTSGYNILYGGNSAGTGLTLANSGTITSTGGTLTVGYYTGDSVTNTGTITANGGTLSLGYASGSAWSSTGALSATNSGVLNLGGTFTTANLGGTVDMSGGGVVNITGTLTNTGATLAAPHTGVYTLYGGTITGGTVASGALTFGASAGVLDGVAMNGNFSVPAYTRFYAQDNATFTGGTTSFDVSAYSLYLTGSGTALTIASDATWTGHFTVYGDSSNVSMVNQGTLVSSSGYNYLSSFYSGFSLSNSGSITSTGGQLWLGYSSTDTFTNTGSVVADGGTVNLGSGTNGSWSTSGSLLAKNAGAINLGGTFTTANLGGTVDMNTGGTVNITGALTNTGATLAAPRTGVYTLNGGTITGGTVASGALTFGSSAGVLDGVAMTGNFSVPDYTHFYSRDNTTFSGGTTTFSGSSYSQYLTGSGTALTIAPDATWTGHFSVYGDSSNVAMVNQGTLVSSSGYNYLTSFYSGFSLSNSGSITATSGQLWLGYSSTDTVTNTGSVVADGGTINFGNGTSGSWSTSGSLLAKNAGAINLGGTFTTANLGGTVDMNTGGAVNITGSLTNTGATLAAPRTGVYTLNGGTITGGTVASGALTFGTTIGVLDGVAMSGNFSVPAYTRFYAQDNTTFTGGTTAFSSSSYSLLLQGTGTALTLSPTETWTGGITIVSDSGSPLVLALQGLLNETSGGRVIDGYNWGGFTINNSGTITASGGSALTLGYGPLDTFSNQSGGVVEANASTVSFGGDGASVGNLSGNTLTGGTWEALSGGVLSFDSSANAVATNNATIILSGSGSVLRTYTGASSSYQSLEQTLTTNNGTLEILGNRGFSASNDLANNGTLVLGGGTFSEHSITTGSGSVIAGTGTFTTTSGGITIGSGMSLSPGIATTGSYVGTLALGPGTPLTLASGGAITFDLKNAASATAGTDYDTISVAGNVAITATPGSPFTLYVESINPSTGAPGSASINFSQGYQWTLLSAGSISGFNAADFSIDSSLFANGLGGGSFSLADTGTSLMLDFSPVPEPSTWVLMGTGLGVAVLAWRRRVSARSLRRA